MKNIIKTSIVSCTVFMLFIPYAVSTQINSNIEPLNPANWYDYWVGQIPTWDNPGNAQTHALNTIRWYLRVNPNVGHVSPHNVNNPENVKRVERLMSQTKFEAVYPNSVLMTKNSHNIIPGEIYNYTNFLKAVAAMPAYCSDYGINGQDEKYPGTITVQMKDPDTLCKRMIAMTFAHATQEVSDGKAGDVQDKIRNTFAQVEENDGNMSALIDENGPFSLQGKFADLVRNNKYYGRGIKQVTYPSNYANTSLLLYSDLRLVEHPQLLAEGFLPFLSAIVYSLTPKDSRQSIAEVMDGSFGLRVKGTSIQDYDRGFSTTISLVNGGPECMGKNITQTKNRIDAYQYFSENGNLFTSGFDPQTYNELSGCEGINHDNAEYFAVNRRYYMMSTATGELDKWAGGIPIFGGKEAHDIFFPKK